MIHMDESLGREFHMESRRWAEDVVKKVPTCRMASNDRLKVAVADVSTSCVVPNLGEVKVQKASMSHRVAKPGVGEATKEPTHMVSRLMEEEVGTVSTFRMVPELWMDEVTKAPMSRVGLRQQGQMG